MLTNTENPSIFISLDWNFHQRFRRGGKQSASVLSSILPGHSATISFDCRHFANGESFAAIKSAFAHSQPPPHPRSQPKKVFIYGFDTRSAYFFAYFGAISRPPTNPTNDLTFLAMVFLVFC